MVFVQIIRRSGGKGLPGTVISITKSNFCFGLDIQSNIQGAYMELYLDKENKKAAFRFTKENQLNSFKLNLNKNAQGRLVYNSTAHVIQKYVPLGKYECKFDTKLGFWVFSYN